MQQQRSGPKYSTLPAGATYLVVGGLHDGERRPAPRRGDPRTLTIRERKRTAPEVDSRGRGYMRPIVSHYRPVAVDGLDPENPRAIQILWIHTSIPNDQIQDRAEQAVAIDRVLGSGRR